MTNSNMKQGIEESRAESCQVANELKTAEGGLSGVLHSDSAPARDRKSVV